MAQAQIAVQVQLNYGKVLTAWRQASCFAALPLMAVIARLMLVICRRFCASFLKI